jgi:putative ABC transport system permease protein
MAWSVPQADREVLLGDLAEEFASRASREGFQCARAWYRRQVWRSVVPNLRRRLFGGRVPGEDSRPRRITSLERAMNDLRNGVRALRATPGFTLAALVVLMLGIGATTAIFSVVDAVVLRALPFDEHDRLVAVGERRPPGPADANYDARALMSIATPNYLDWAAGQQVFEAMAAVVGPPFASFTLTEPGIGPEDIAGVRVTSEFFDVLRIQPALGRAFTTEHEVDGRHRVVLLSDALWRRRFGANPAVIGKTMVFDDGSYEVLGVMPPGAMVDVAYPGGAARPTEILVPYVFPARERLRTPGGRVMITKSVARLKPGVTIDQAQAQMDQIAAALEKANPVWNKDNRAGVRPLGDHLVGTSTRSWMLMVLGAVAIVLVIACANVANLLLVRATAREREVAVRAALGAGRLHLVRQFMVESLLLSLAGTVLATVLAWWLVEILRAAMPDGVPRVSGIAVNLRVLGAAAGLAVVTGLLFGIAPALQFSRPDLTHSLNEAARSASAGRGRRRLRAALVVAEVALAVVLVVGASLFIASFIAVLRIDPGFNPAGVLAVQVTTRGQFGKGVVDAPEAFTQIVDQISQSRGVTHAAMSFGGLPLVAGIWTTTFSVPGRPDVTDVTINARAVTPDYHKVLGIPLRRGRLLEPADRASVAPVVVLNESAARQYFPGEDPIGRVVTVSRDECTIVGVVGDVHQVSLEAATRAEVYVPLAQVRPGARVELVVRTSGDPYEALPAVRAAVTELLPGVPLRNVRTMERVFAAQIAQRRLNMLLLGLFGILGLVISAVGIFGVMAYVVSQRTREIGVRMALGATRASVLRMVFGDAALLVAAGLAVGSACAWSLSTTAKAFLFGLEPTNPWAFAAALALLSLAGIVASALPARRAASVDPVAALRAE